MRILLAFLLLLDIRPGRACEVLNPSDLPASYALGSNTVGVVWVEGSYQGTSYYYSGFVIGQLVDQTGNVLQTYIAMPMHPGPGVSGASIVAAGNGNALSPSGIIFTNLTAAYLSPLWNENNPWGNAGDISIYQSPTAAPTNWVHQIAPPGSLQSGAIVTSVGYGIPSTPNGTLTPAGNVMGFNALISLVTLNNIEPGDYFSGQMAPAYEIPINGAGNGSDSGSIALNAEGQILGMTVAASGGPTDIDRTTAFENWTAPDFYNQIAPYAGIIVSPPTLNSQASGTNLLLSWTGPFILQSSTNAAGGFADITNAASPYTNAMTAPQQFFRLRSN